MSTLRIGKTYKLVDSSKDFMLHHAINEELITLPEDGIVTVHSIEVGQVTGEAMGCSHTEGVSGRRCAQADVAGDVLVLQQTSLDTGAFIEVVEDLA